MGEGQSVALGIGKLLMLVVDFPHLTPYIIGEDTRHRRAFCECPAPPCSSSLTLDFLSFSLSLIILSHPANPIQSQPPRTLPPPPSLHPQSKKNHPIPPSPPQQQQHQSPARTYFHLISAPGLESAPHASVPFSSCPLSPLPIPSPRYAPVPSHADTVRSEPRSIPCLAERRSGRLHRADWRDGSVDGCAEVGGEGGIEVRKGG